MKAILDVAEKAILDVAEKAKRAGRPSCLVLFDGFGLCRLALQQAGFMCVGVELDENKCLLSRALLQDAFGLDTPVVCMDVLRLTSEVVHAFDAVWCSPPCQQRSMANISGRVARPALSRVLINWSLGLEPGPLVDYPGVLWVENVYNRKGSNSWGTIFNQVQFQEEPTQCRNRVIGGSYPPPCVLREHKVHYGNLNGVRFEEDPVTHVVSTVRDTRVAPAFKHALNLLPPTVADRLRLYLEPIRGIAPTLLASEGRSPGSVNDSVPRAFVQNGASDDFVRRHVDDITQDSPETKALVQAVLKREYYYRKSSRCCSRFYRRQVTVREALCIMSVATPSNVDTIAMTLLQARPPGTSAKRWNATVLHAIGNGVPPVMVRALANAVFLD